MVVYSIHATHIYKTRDTNISHWAGEGRDNVRLFWYVQGARYEQEEEEKRVEINHSTIDKTQTHTHTQEFNVDIPQLRVDGRDWESRFKKSRSAMSIQRVTCHRDWFINRALQLEGFFLILLPFFLQKNEIRETRKATRQQYKAALSDKGRYCTQHLIYTDENWQLPE